MSEPRGAQLLETKIATRISNSALGKADATDEKKYGIYIDNPVTSIVKPLTGSVGKPPKDLGKTVIADFAPSWDLLRPELSVDRQRVLGAEGTKPLADRVKTYLDWGAAHAREQPFNGVCESFNCVVLAMLMASNSPLPADTVIEYIGVKVWNFGHAVCAIGRANATQPVGDAVKDALDTWGNDCIIVDQWYALQAGCGPVFHIAGPQADANYVDWLNKGAPAFTVCGRLTVGNPKRQQIVVGRSQRPF